MISCLSCPSCGRGGTYIDESEYFTRNWQDNDVRIECHCKYCDNRWVNVYTMTQSEKLL